MAQEARKITADASRSFLREKKLPELKKNSPDSRSTFSFS
jgi:hypothetical protein